MATQPSPLDALALLGGLLAGKSINSNSAQNAVPPQLSQLLQMSVDRSAAQNPQFSAANQGIFSMLPNFAKQGITPPSPLSSTAPAPSSGGGMSPLLAGGLGAAGGAGLASLLGGGSGSGGNLGGIADAIKKLFGGGSSTLNPVGGAPDQGPNQFGSQGGPNLSLSDFMNWINPSGQPPQMGGGGPLMSDPGSYVGATPTDPSGGSGFGPGMGGGSGYGDGSQGSP